METITKDVAIKMIERVRSVLNGEGKEVLTKRQMEDMLFNAIRFLEAN